MDQQSVPSVAPISQGQQQSQIPSIDQILQIAIPNSGPAPPATTTQHVSNPQLPYRPQQQLVAPVRPMSGDAMDRKRARVQNNWASVANTVKTFTNNQAQKKEQGLVHNIKTVMDAQQQVDNATQIIQNKAKYSPQDVQNAQLVMEQNKQVLDRLFSDKKTSKDLQKAFDVSFTDMEKNNTPEVKAMHKAKKEFDISKQSGLNVDNPAESRVQALANNPNAGNMQPQEQQHRMITAGTNPSSASYADQFLNQQRTQLAANPAYEAAIKQAEERQKNATKIAPSIINATAAGERNAATVAGRSADNAATNKAREEVAAAQIQQRQQAATLAAQTRLRAVSMQQAGENARLVKGIQMREDLVNKKDQTPANQEKLSVDILKALQTGNADLSRALTGYEAEKAALGNKVGPVAIAQYDELINSTKSQIAENNERIKNVNLRLSNLNYKGTLSGGTNPEPAATKPSGPGITNGNSVGSDDPDNFDTEPD